MSKKVVLLLMVVFMYGCGSATGGNYKDSYPYQKDPIMKMSAAPSEGWATDPNLSYNLYSYYPMNFYNNTIYSNMGLYGISFR